MDDKLKIGLLLKMVHNTFDKKVNSDVTAMELTSSQCDIMGYLHKHRDCEINPLDIERDMKLSRPTVTGLLQRLNEKGFIVYTQSSKGKKYKQIQITEKADIHKEQMDVILSSLEKKMLEGLSPGQIKDLGEMLEKMLYNLNK